jgi:hypothetical protein
MTSCIVSEQPEHNFLPQDAKVSTINKSNKHTGIVQEQVRAAAAVAAECIVRLEGKQLSAAS